MFCNCFTQVVILKIYLLVQFLQWSVVEQLTFQVIALHYWQVGHLFWWLFWCFGTGRSKLRRGHSIGMRTRCWVLACRASQGWVKIASGGGVEITILFHRRSEGFSVWRSSPRPISGRSVCRVATSSWSWSPFQNARHVWIIPINFKSDRWIDL